MKSPWWPVLLAEQQAGRRLIAAEQAVWERWEEIGQWASSLILLTQLSILLFLKHIQGFLISLLRAEPRTYIMYVWSGKKSCARWEKSSALIRRWGEGPLPVIWHAGLPQFRGVAPSAPTACILLSCFVLFHQLIYMMATTYNFAVLKFKSREDCCTKF